VGTFRVKSDLRNHQAIVQPRVRLLDIALMVTQMTLIWKAVLYHIDLFESS
jgi:hypothetical protein